MFVSDIVKMTCLVIRVHLYYPVYIEGIYGCSTCCKTSISHSSPLYTVVTIATVQLDVMFKSAFDNCTCCSYM